MPVFAPESKMHIAIVAMISVSAPNPFARPKNIYIYQTNIYGFG